MKHRAFDILGSVAIVNFSLDTKQAEKKRFARKLLNENKTLETILEKSGKFSGRLRKMKTKFIAGEKTKEVLYKENGCAFRFNIDSTYFSPRLSNERKEIASKIKKDEIVLVMFAGVGPYSIVIAKNSKCKKVYSNEINREANKYAKLNIELNNLKNGVELVNGDIKRVAKGWLKSHRDTQTTHPLFDVIVMPRPRLKDSFLKEAFLLSKKGTRIYYYDFCSVEDIDKIIGKIKSEAKKAKKKIKILRKKSAGEIAPYKIRVRIDFLVL